ncbi:MAG TPA: hypothetical protein VFD17_05685, partial [Clostridia bacterium]|nr:hypothetical protein [Clostridia bacterium]
SKLSGEMGISLGQMFGTDLRDIVQENEDFFTEYMPNYKFSALYAKNIGDELKDMLHKDFLENISLVMSDYKKGNNLIDFLDDSILSVKFNLDGYEHETMDDIRMVCIANALGMCNMKVDMGRVIYPESSSDEWHHLSLKWSKGNTYFNDFAMLDMVSIHELEERVRRFLAIDYIYEHNYNRIDIYIDHFEEEAYFVLITNNEIVDFVENGTYEKISDYMYLIKATGAKVCIHTIEDNFLDKPKNNKLVPSTPERLLESDL